MKHIFPLIVVCALFLFLTPVVQAQERVTTANVITCTKLDDAKKLTDIHADVQTNDELTEVSLLVRKFAKQGRCFVANITSPTTMSSNELKYYRKRGNAVIGVIFVKLKNGNKGYAIVFGSAKQDNQQETQPEKQRGLEI